VKLGERSWRRYRCTGTAIFDDLSFSPVYLVRRIQYIGVLLDEMNGTKGTVGITRR